MDELKTPRTRNQSNPQNTTKFGPQSPHLNTTLEFLIVLLFGRWEESGLVVNTGSGLKFYGWKLP